MGGFRRMTFVEAATGSAALALALLGVTAAQATTLIPSDTVTDPGTVTVSGSGAATVITPTVSYSVADAFNGSTLTDFPTTVAQGSGGPFNFYDDYVFTVSTSTVQASVVSFATDAVGISDLQARIFSTSAPYTAAVAASNLSLTPASGTVVDDAWTTVGSGELYTVDLAQTTLTPGTYDLQIRGEVASSGSGSYGGSVSFTALTPVPLPGGLPLLLSGVGLLGITATRRRVRRG